MCFFSSGNQRTHLVPEAILSTPSGSAGSEATSQHSVQQAQETKDQETEVESVPLALSQTVTHDSVTSPEAVSPSVEGPLTLL